MVKNLIEITSTVESRFKKARFKKDFFPKSGNNRDFLAILEQFLGVFFHFLA